MNVVCCQLEVSATVRSIVQSSPSECGVSECDLEISPVRKPRRARVVESLKKKFCIWVFVWGKLVLNYS